MDWSVNSGHVDRVFVKICVIYISTIKKTSLTFLSKPAVLNNNFLDNQILSLTAGICAVISGMVLPML